MADPMRIRANVVGDSTEVKVLMSHEMETGQRKDSQGKNIPAWFIQDVTATHNGMTVLSAQWGPAVAKNPRIGPCVAASLCVATISLRRTRRIARRLTKS